MESDPYKLIDIALSYVPQEGAFAQAIRTAVKSKRDGVSFREAVVSIHESAPGTFGVQSITHEEAKERSKAMGFATVGEPGRDAPENVAFAMAAWLYGKDFGECLTLSNSAGEDTDCSTATLGATIGIILGASKIPEKWAAPLDDKIVTMCIDKTWGGIWVPSTCTELAERILNVAPGFLGAEKCDHLSPGGYTIFCQDSLYCDNKQGYQQRMNGSGKDHHLSISALTGLGSHVLRQSFPAFEMLVDLVDEPFFTAGQQKRIRVSVKNCFEMRQQQWVRIRLHVPEGVDLADSGELLLPLNNLWGAGAQAEFAFTANAFRGSRLEVLIEAQLEGRHSYGVIKAQFARGGLRLSDAARAD